MNENFLTRKQLMKATGANPEQITYLRLRKRLPVLNEPDKGIPAKYALESIEIVKDWLEKRNK
ncbi:hypothetical protein KJ762_00575 [bacterium]|nr:hypothetical protein [bacterium]MBU1632988.1 hypothetical protein [bacterium]MBU1875316.1 hypothetical protein [bacterium]